MPKIIDYIGEQTEISDYLPEHYPENQQCDVVKGTFINPHMRKDFDHTPNEERETLEIEHWYGRPYIVTDQFHSETYQEYMLRTSKIAADYQPESEEEFNERTKRDKEFWFARYPTGIRYEVRCLTGGAWDRSSSQGMFPDLDEAVEVANHGVRLYGFM